MTISVGYFLEAGAPFSNTVPTITSKVSPIDGDAKVNAETPGAGCQCEDDSYVEPMARSLAGKRFPKFYFVSFWIDDPSKLPVFGIVDLLENVAALVA